MNLKKLQVLRGACMFFIKNIRLTNHNLIGGGTKGASVRLNPGEKHPRRHLVP